MIRAAGQAVPLKVIQKGLFPVNFGMNLEPLDTSDTVRNLQEQAHIRLGPEGRLRVALDLSQAVRDLRLAGMRSGHPGASEAELVRRFIIEAHGIQPEAIS
jgi:hypothetical protein